MHVHCQNLVSKGYHESSQYFFDKIYHNIPRACLLNRLPVPAMDLKSNRSGL